MLWISHRGNLSGPKPEHENKLQYIQAAFVAGYDVEVDVREHNGHLYLGHDEPQERLPEYLLSNKKFWFHAKDFTSLEMLHRYKSSIPDLKYFWHQDDDYTLTSNNKIWTYPGKKLLVGAIAVVPEVAYDGELWDCYAICTDYILKYKGLYESRHIS